jgi:hypothetical protein
LPRSGYYIEGIIFPETYPLPGRYGMMIYFTYVLQP